MDAWVAPLICECVGSAAVVFVGAGAAIATVTRNPAGSSLLATALAYGFVTGVFMMAAGHISRGCFNPAIALGLLAAGRLSVARAVGYIVAELAGGVIGSLLLKGVFPTNLVSAVALGTPVVGSGYTISEALLAEIVATFFLMFVFYGTVIDRRGPRRLGGFAVGLTIVAGVFSIGAVSGGAMNPARHFGPALVQSSWQNGWIWYVGPILGALIASVLYEYVLMPQSSVRRSVPM